jgi:hypothetical protein
MGSWIATHYAASPSSARSRQHEHIPTATLADVRLLTDSTDAETCRKVLAGVQRFISAQGGTLAPTTPEFYQVGDLYYAVLVLHEHHPIVPPGYVYIDGRWTPLLILNQNFEVVAAIAT